MIQELVFLTIQVQGVPMDSLIISSKLQIYVIWVILTFKALMIKDLHCFQALPKVN